MVLSYSSIFWQFPVQVLLTTDLHLSTQNETHQGTLLAIQFLFLAVIQENHIRKLQSLLIEWVYLNIQLINCSVFIQFGTC